MKYIYKLVLFLAVIGIAAFGIIPEANALSKSCDETFGPDVYKPTVDKLIVCDGAVLNVRGRPTKANVTADNTNPTDTATITVQLQDDEGNNITTGSTVKVYTADTNVIGNGSTALNGGTNGNDGISQTSGDSGSILTEYTADAFIELETNESGKATFKANDSQDVDRWVNVKLQTGEVKQLKLNFD